MFEPNLIEIGSSGVERLTAITLNNTHQVRNFSRNLQYVKIDLYLPSAHILMQTFSDEKLGITVCLPILLLTGLKSPPLTGNIMIRQESSVNAKS